MAPLGRSLTIALYLTCDRISPAIAGIHPPFPSLALTTPLV
ncbi:hypothetical protein [Leptolyngbya sp. PCC 6406]|nr:hypothetical protein [Leptolyngbya sp. PCC 6406]